MHLHLISRKKAKDIGLKFYFSGTPCLHGNIALRRTPNFQCTCPPCYESERVRERAARKTNVQHRKDYREAYHAANRDELNQKKRERYQKNRDALLAGTQAWRKANPEHLRDYKRKTGRSDCAKRRASKRERIPPWFGEFDQFVMAECSTLAFERTLLTGVIWHVDHMIPLLARKACGLHCGHNLQVIPAFLNLKKQNRMIYTRPDEWLSELIQRRDDTLPSNLSPSWNTNGCE